MNGRRRRTTIETFPNKSPPDEKWCIHFWVVCAGPRELVYLWERASERRYANLSGRRRPSANGTTHRREEFGSVAVLVLVLEPFRRRGNCEIRKQARAAERHKLNSYVSRRAANSFPVDACRIISFHLVGNIKNARDATRFNNTPFVIRSRTIFFIRQTLLSKRSRVANLPSPSESVPTPICI